MPVSVTDIKTFKEVPCGACACAIGHGPAAGVRRHMDSGWSEYALRVFGTGFDDCPAGDYMFGWHHPNDAGQAAVRIQEVIEAVYARNATA